MGLFRKDIDPRCAYCVCGRQLGHGDVGCVHKGVVKEYFHCKRFRYDPLRRVPHKPVRLGKNYTEDDFKI
jgi:hypothetical protein